MDMVMLQRRPGSSHTIYGSIVARVQNDITERIHYFQTIQKEFPYIALGSNTSIIRHGLVSQHYRRRNHGVY
jgi:hypothetical protein